MLFFNLVTFGPWQKIYSKIDPKTIRNERVKRLFLNHFFIKIFFRVKILKSLKKVNFNIIQFSNPGGFINLFLLTIQNDLLTTLGVRHSKTTREAIIELWLAYFQAKKNILNVMLLESTYREGLYFLLLAFSGEFRFWDLKTGVFIFLKNLPHSL